MAITRSAITPYGPRLTLAEALELYESKPFFELLNLADERRRVMSSDNVVTYLVDRNINYTNACTINCQFCSFYRPPGHPQVYTQTIDQISDRISELESIGGTRILMQGGVNPDLKMEWYTDLLTELKRRHPSIALDCFSPIEIEGIADVTGLSTFEVLSELKSAGMSGLPGGGAEMLVDEVRSDISPIKGSSQNWLNVMEEAQSIGLTTSATNVIGFGETLQQRILHLRRLEIYRTKLLPRDILDSPLSSRGLSNWKITRSVKGIGAPIERRWGWSSRISSAFGYISIVLGQYTTYPSVLAYNGS